MGGAGDALLAGRYWADSTLTYGFPDSADAYAGDYGSGEADSFAPLSHVQIAAVEAALDAFAAVSGLSFVRDDAAPVLRFAQSDAPPSAHAYLPDDTPEGGDVWLGALHGFYEAPVAGGFAWHGLLHEIGHAIGLKHGHEVSAAGALEPEQDSMEWSVMTYRAYVGDPMQGGYSTEAGGYAQTLMRADIAALQQLYGANYAHNAGDTTYRWDPQTGEMFVDGAGRGAPLANRVFGAIWDGGGNDTLDFSAQDQIVVDLAPSGGALFDEAQRAWLNGREDAPPIKASANVYFVLLHEDDPRALLENVIATMGDDIVGGNDARNLIRGGSGADSLDGGAGDDRLLGGAGADVIEGGAGRDRVVAGPGEDRVGGGGAGDRLSGGAGADHLSGGAGADRLIGGAGADTLVGGKGADVMSGGAGADRFVFSPNDGPDRITDFGAHDSLDFSALEIGFRDLRFLDAAQGLRIVGPGADVLLSGVAADELAAGQMLF